MRGYRCIGSFKDQPGIKRPEDYFSQRDTFLDCRGLNMIEFDETAELGWEVAFHTQTHELTNFWTVTDRPIIVKKKAWIASHSLLFNCLIGEGAIVAAGSVVRSRVVPAFSAVEGNPARVFKMYSFYNKTWERVDLALEPMKR